MDRKPKHFQALSAFSCISRFRTNQSHFDPFLGFYSLKVSPKVSPGCPHVPREFTGIRNNFDY
jgi:hypothetical protein